MTKLRYVLMQKGLSGKQFAELCGMSCSTVYKYMSNCRTLSKKVAHKFAFYLNVEVDDIIGLL